MTLRDTKGQCRAKFSCKGMRQKDRVGLLDLIISKESEAEMAMSNANSQVAGKRIEPMLIAGVRMKGKVRDAGAL